jgi:hypothetical protein
MNLLLNKKNPYKVENTIQALERIGEVEVNDYETHIEVKIDLERYRHSAYVQNAEVQELHIIDNNTDNKSVCVVAIPLSTISQINSL